MPKEKIREIKIVSKELGKDVELAYLTDQLKEERERNITIDTTQIFFKIRKRNYVIIDTPGHTEFIKNMITGTTLAEVAILIVDVQEGIMEQTRRHAYLISMLGLNRVIVLFNKMDLVDYKKERFNKVKLELLRFLGHLKIEPLFFIPVSAKEGINICKKSRKMNWYKGLTLLKALDLLNLDTNSIKRPLRFPVQDVYEIENEKIIVGRIASGVIKQGQKVVLSLAFKEATIKAIKVFGRHKTVALNGECVGLILKEPLSIERGEIIVQKDTSSKATNHFKGSIFWISRKPLQINKTITLRCATQEVKGIAEKIERRINTSTLEVIEENANELKLNEAGVVVFKTKKSIIIEKFSFIEELGRFVIECEYNLRDAGIIIEKPRD
ncbi:MAG: adenylyl-sulfate kinase [Candidatus Omnitrophica bacterium]|nr:adenylyl-sulfate kinase [Candidatus Omnitrophota bacterium]